MTQDRTSLAQLLEVLGPNPEWIAFIEDEPTRLLFTQVASKSSLPTVSVQPGIAQARSFLTSGIEPQLIIVDLSKSEDLIGEAKALINYCSLNTRMMIIGKDDRASTFRDLTHIGAIDYLVIPLEENNVRTAINDALQIPAQQSAKNIASKIKPFTVILGARGGVGSSTLSINLCYLTAIEFQKKVCLIDFDLYHGNICILLDLVQNAGLNEALTEVERLDEVFLKRLILQKENNFSVLTGQIPLEQEINFSIDAVKILTTLLRDKYDYIFADMPPLLNSPLPQTVLNLADNVIIVTDFSLVCVQSVLRLKTFLATYMPHIKYKLIANEIFPNGGAVSRSMFEKAINSTIDTVLPYCKSSMIEGMNAGEPFVKINTRHVYTERLRQFISSLYPQLKPIIMSKPSLMDKLRRLGK